MIRTNNFAHAYGGRLYGYGDGKEDIYDMSAKVGNNNYPARIMLINGKETPVFLADDNRMYAVGDNKKPFEIWSQYSLPEVTVTPSKNKNKITGDYYNNSANRYYDSSYDPNGFMDFMNAATLGIGNRLSVSQNARLVKDIYDATTGNKSWEDVVNSAVLGNNGIFVNPYANMALDIIVPTVGGKYRNIVNVGKGIANTTAKGVVNISKSVANATKDLSKSAYNLYDNGTLWDRYTTFRGRFGNYSDNPFVNAYATIARRFGLPDKARIPADAMRKMGQAPGDFVNIKDGVVDFTGGKGWGNKPHVNFTLDRGVGSHNRGDWNGKDMYIMPTEDFINQTLPSGSLKSIEPTDMFANGVHVTEDPSKVTVISGDIETLKKAQEAGMQTLSSPKLRKMYQDALNSYNRSIEGLSPFLAKTVKTPKRTLGIDYAREVQRLQGLRGTPTLSDFRLLEKMTGLKSGVTSVSEYNKAIDAISRMLHDQVGVAKQYVYPNGRAVDWSINGINWQLKNLKQLPYNNVFYDPASYVESNWRHAIGLE